MTPGTMLRALVPLAMIVIVCPGARAGDEPGGGDELLEKWMAVYQQHAEALDMSVVGDPERRLDLHAGSLLKYTNPVRGVQQHGAIYVWTLQGRPAVLASIWSAIDLMQPQVRKLNYEWHSLSAEDVTAKRNSELLWTSGEPGVEWHAFPEFGTVAASRPLRLVQMRRIARMLTAHIDTEESELRLLEQPIYRYPDDVPGVVDGGVFSYVMGTDPELLLMVEAAETDDGGREWRVACARFSNWPMQVSLKEREFWSCEHATPRRDRGRYYLWFAVERLPADLAGVEIAAPGAGDRRD